MNILILNGSPRATGSTAKMIAAFTEGAEQAGHSVKRVDVCRKKIAGCLACEYCHTKENGVCIQRDDMQEIYALLQEADMLVLASPIYYHNISGQLKCAVDRFYAVGAPGALRLRKVAMILASGDPDTYVGAQFSYYGDCVDYLGLESMGIFTANGEMTEEKLAELRAFGRSLA